MSSPLFETEASNKSLFFSHKFEKRKSLSSLAGGGKVDMRAEIFFQHKSAMQLQQQQQAVAAQQVQGGGHHMGPHGPLMRAGSSSGSESGAGISKPHQCQQCLKVCTFCKYFINY
ncbi:hypothetical protein Fcan01_07628 [Folsomia candida]|uniref:Uncharacterized protein n=1 Tax=Folsomia candida TaxID=158441 RepID=A0A226EK72_FOLCA|nr:hypothetical protein Fcan01_07628 [Folsomia candida]